MAVASAAVMCSVFGALNGNLLVGPRLLYAMGKDCSERPATDADEEQVRVVARFVEVVGEPGAIS